MADVATQKPIPLVNNIIPDGALNTLNLKEAKTTVTVEGTLKLVSDRHSEKLVDRHFRSIKRLTQQYKNGFLIKDITAVGHLIAVCAGRLENDLTYEKPLCDILKVCRLVISNASARLYVSSPCLVSKELLYDWLETMGKLDQHDTKDNVSPRFQKFRNERQSVIV